MRSSKSRWCVLTADKHGAARVISGERAEQASAPIIFSRLGGSATLLQQGLLRAARIAPSSQVLVTVQEEYRSIWEPALWFIRPENRFIASTHGASLLTAAASVLAIAKHSLSNIVVLLPAQCHITHEAVVTAAIENACSKLPYVREGVITLGMRDLDDSADEDYLIPDLLGDEALLDILGVARRPALWVTRHLRSGGAMVASGIMVGYAGVFAAHISKHLPGLAQQLDRPVTACADTGNECDITAQHISQVPRSSLRALAWSPPILRQRALCVSGSGWSGLRSPKSIERLLEYYRTQSSPKKPSWLIPKAVVPELERPAEERFN